jgi:hypothetical protein
MPPLSVAAIGSGASEILLHQIGGEDLERSDLFITLGFNKSPPLFGGDGQPQFMPGCEHEL